MRIEGIHKSTFNNKYGERVPQVKTKKQLEKETADFKEIFEQAKKNLAAKNKPDHRL